MRRDGRAARQDRGRVRAAKSVDEAPATISVNSETSGGLRIAIPADRAAALQRELADRGVGFAAFGEFVVSTGVLVKRG